MGNMCVPLSGTKNLDLLMQAVNRVGGQSFVYVVEEDKSKENRNLWCIKTCEIKRCAERCYPVLEGIKVGIRWQFQHSQTARWGTHPTRILESWRINSRLHKPSPPSWTNALHS